MVSALLALGLKEHFEKKSHNESKRLDAYLRLAAASEIVALRFVIYNAQMRTSAIFGETVMSNGKFLLLVILQLFRRGFQPGTLKMLVDAIPNPVALKKAVDPPDTV